MTRNTGHQYCKNKPEAPDLATPAQCSMTGSQVGTNPFGMDDIRPSSTGMSWPKLHWFKVKGDVYRQWISNALIPNQGI